VVGNANSANDIASQLAEAESESETHIYPIYRSIRRLNSMHYFLILPHPNLGAVASVAQFSLFVDGGSEGKDGKKEESTNTKAEDVESSKEVKGTATLHLTDGTSIPNIDYVFFGTGYAYYIPFVRALSPTPTPSPNNPSARSNSSAPLRQHQQ